MQNDDNPSLWAAKAYFSRVRKKKIDIVNDTQFKEANEMFHAMLVKLKQAGKGSTFYTQSQTQRPNF